MADVLYVPCEHGHIDAHCDEHPGIGSHFDVVAHEGGCWGVQPASDVQIMERAKELGMVKPEPEMADRCSECGFYDGHWTVCSRSTTASRHTDPCTTCGGTGIVCPEEPGLPYAECNHPPAQMDPCPTCSTDGGAG